MSIFFNNSVITTGLAIFSMFFGAGNLMFPLMIGLISGEQATIGIAGFILTGVFIPFLGLIAIILFQGDYAEFFYRLGKIPGATMIVFWTSIAGPLIAMPRIVTLSHTMIQPFIPCINLPMFSIFFLLLTFIATWKESKIVDILGNVISPLLLVSLGIIITKGFLTANEPIPNTLPASKLFIDSLLYGYQTLDILSGILFSSIVITILQSKFATPGKADFKKLAWLSFKAGLLGVSLLAIVYIGLGYLGAYFGHNMSHVNEGELFSLLSFKIIGPHGAGIVALAVMLACYSTIIALAAVYSEFLHHQVLNKRINYLSCLLITLTLTLVTSNIGLSGILTYSRPIINITYPSLIVLTVCNIAHKVGLFHAIKMPVLITLAVSLIGYVLY